MGARVHYKGPGALGQKQRYGADFALVLGQEVLINIGASILGMRICGYGIA